MRPLYGGKRCADAMVAGIIKKVKRTLIQTDANRRVLFSQKETRTES